MDLHRTIRSLPACHFTTSGGGVNLKLDAVDLDNAFREASHLRPQATDSERVLDEFPNVAHGYLDGCDDMVERGSAKPLPIDETCRAPFGQANKALECVSRKFRWLDEAFDINFLSLCHLNLLSWLVPHFAEEQLRHSRSARRRYDFDHTAAGGFATTIGIIRAKNALTRVAAGSSPGSAGALRPRLPVMVTIAVGGALAAVNAS